VTRGQAAKILALAAGYTDAIPGTLQTFADVPTDHPFWLYIERAARHGLINGYTCGAPGEPCNPLNAAGGGQLYFRPAASLTRGQLAKIIANASGLRYEGPPQRPTFTDVPTTHPFYLYIETLVAHGVLSGYQDGTFRPGLPVTRGQAAKIVANTFYASRIVR
jgi:hypothetical protein